MNKPFGIKLICLWLAITCMSTLLVAFHVVMSKTTLMIPNDKKIAIIQTPQWQGMKITTLQEFDDFQNKQISQGIAYVFKSLPQSIVAFILAIGLWKMRKWSRIWVIVYAISLMLVEIGLLALVTKHLLISRFVWIIIYIIAVYYLTRPKVKEQLSS